MRKLITPVLLTAAAALGGVVGGHYHAPKPGDCPKGYYRSEVRVPGSRIESGIDPVTHLNRPEIVSNTWAEQNNGKEDHRYVVTLTCVRMWNEAERAADYNGTYPPQIIVSVPPKGTK